MRVCRHQLAVDTPPRLDGLPKDVAPTPLHWMGHAMPTDMDGEPVTAALADGSDPAERAVETRSPLPERSEQSRELDDEIRGRLEDIGYME